MDNKTTTFMLPLTTGLICLLVYLPALACGFVNLDDPIFVINNVAIRELNGNLLAWAFSSRTPNPCVPLTWISFAVDYRLWGLNPVGYHLTNILLHAVNTALVALIAGRLLDHGATGKTGKPPASPTGQRHFWLPVLAAFLFGVHPLRVESVAWVTERKDVLNGVFSLASLLFYLRYAEKRQSGAGVGGEYLASISLFVFSLLAKPISVVLPLLFLVVDWYPLRRLQKGTARAVLLEKAPFLLISAAVSVATLVFFNQKQLLADLSSLSVVDRFFLSGNAVFEYCRLLLLPVGILPFYEMPDAITVSHVVKTVLVLAGTFFALAVSAKRPWILASWLGFILPLLPVLAFFQCNDVAFAARYTYLPSVAASLIAASGIALACDKMMPDVVSWRHPVVVAAVLLVLGYAGMTQRLIAVWHDTEALWTRVIVLEPATTKYMDRGVYYLLHGRQAAAEADFSSAITWLVKRGKAPDHNVFAFRGVARLDLGKFGAAGKDFSSALALKEHPTYYQYRGLALQAQGKKEAAAEDFRRAGPNPPPIDSF